jgi:hypothetical protein
MLIQGYANEIKHGYITITNERLIGDNEASNTIIADGLACIS